MPGHLLASALLLAAVFGFGSAFSATLGSRLEINTPTRAALVPLSGVASVGLITLVVGHLGLLGVWLPWVLALAGLCLLVVRRQVVATLLQAIARGATAQARRYPVPVLAVTVGMAFAVVASFAPPSRVDEIEYHWPAPLAWAEAGGWNDSPFRHVDGFPFMEVVYTAAATHGSYAAAHLLHLVTLVGLGLAAGGAAQALGVRGIGPVVAAAMAMPVAWDGAYAAYNDTAVGAFGAAAVAVVLAGRRFWGSVVLAAGLLSIGISIKPTALAAVGLVGLVILLARAWIPDHMGQPLANVLKAWVLLGASALATAAFWSARRWYHTGDWREPPEPMNEDVMSRLPDSFDQLVAPLMPFVTGIVGAQEPWGGRTSLVVQLFLIPTLLYVLWARGEALREFATVVLPAWVHWVVLGLVGVRTRFHIVSWVLLVVGVRSAVESAQQRWPQAGRWLEAAWSLAVVLGVVDVSFEMVRLIANTWFGGAA